MADLLNYRKEDSDMNYNINEQKLGFDRVLPWEGQVPALVKEGEHYFLQVKAPEAENVTFTMNEDTDTAAFFSACLGKIGDNQITTQHEVHIDDISLEEVKDDPKDDIKDNPKDNPKDDIKDNPKDDLKQDIKTDIKNEQPKVPAPVIKTSDSDKAKTTQAVKESKTAKAAKTAKTGDNSPILAYVFGAMAGALILGVSFLKKRKKTNN